MPFSDAFADTAGTALSAHVSDSGHTWATLSGELGASIDADGSGIKAPSDGALRTNKSNYSVVLATDRMTLTFNAPTGGSGDWRVGFGWDSSASKNGVDIRYSSSTGNTTIGYYNSSTTRTTLVNLGATPLTGSHSIGFENGAVYYDGVAQDIIGGGGITTPGLFIEALNGTGRDAEITSLTASSNTTVTVTGFMPVNFGTPSSVPPTIVQVEHFRPVRFGVDIPTPGMTVYARGFMPAKLPHIVALKYAPET